MCRGCVRAEEDQHDEDHGEDDDDHDGMVELVEHDRDRIQGAGVHAVHGGVERAEADRDDRLGGEPQSEGDDEEDDRPDHPVPGDAEQG
jgi:hypothetical protein